jgi:uncharacterized protein
MKKHSTHPEIIKRLKRALGHLQGVITMMEEGRECLLLAQQLSAVESAITKAKQTLIHDHLDHCLDDALVNRNSVSEFKEITKYL